MEHRLSEELDRYLAALKEGKRPSKLHHSHLLLRASKTSHPFLKKPDAQPLRQHLKNLSPVTQWAKARRSGDVFLENKPMAPWKSLSRRF